MSEIQLTFNKGITNVPSDQTCDDNCLEESMGMFYDNGEHRVVQKPMEYMTSARKIIFVHHPAGTQENYIAIDSNNLTWGIRNANGEFVPSEQPLINGVRDYKVAAIGNTLVVASSEGLTYLLWDKTKANPSQDPAVVGNYKVIGNKIPDIRVQFNIHGSYIEHPEKYIRMDGMLDGYVIVDDSSGVNPDYQVVGSRFHPGQYEGAKSTLIGLVTSRLNNVKRNKRFAFPFWARSAVKLYDGSYINISNPILLLPTVRDNWWIYSCDDNGDEIIMSEHLSDGGWQLTNYRPYSGELHYKVILPSGFNPSDWEDIIKGVEIFVSDEAKSFDMEGDWKICNCDSTEAEERHPLVDSSCYDGNGNVYRLEKRIRQYQYNPPNDPSWKTYFKPTLKSDSEIIDNLISNSTFYELIELDMDDISQTGWHVATSKISSSDLMNITTQPRLEHDDYFSRSTMEASIIRAFNSRLHLAGVKRGFFEGFNFFSVTEYNDLVSRTTEFYVHIRSESGERIVKSPANTLGICDIWFYYPDPRAYKVDIVINGTVRKTLSLTEHPKLNGAYYFKRLPEVTENVPASTSVTPPSTITDKEDLPNQLIVSAVDNPYLFNAEGYTKISLGNIIGIAAQTVALNEEEHGIHPLVVFTDRGIVTAKQNDEGIYLRVDELPRDVCNNPDSITEVDGAVFFSSEKGLMAIVGAEAKCVSEQLSGKSTASLQKYLRTAFIAYDYRDSLLWIFDGHKENGVLAGSRYCYLYSIKTGTFSRYDFNGSIITSIVNNYPDFLLQSGSHVYTLIGRQNINEDSDRYSGQIITRPMKLDAPLALKTITHLRNIRQFADDEITQGQQTVRTLRLTVKGSNDLRNWNTLTGLRGNPWKYYRFQYDFSGMKATDRFAGAVIITQERRTNKMR